MKKFILITTAVFFSVNIFSQSDITKRGAAMLQEKNYKGAAKYIDSCINIKEYSKDAGAWYIKGYAYKGIYNTQEKENKESPSRIIALESFKKSMELDNSKTNVDENLKNIKFLAATLYNDVSTTLDTVKYDIAIRNWELYKKYAPIVDTSKSNRQELDNKFELALSSVFAELYGNRPKHDMKFYNMAKQLYLEILKVDENNKYAQKNLKILEYNKAVFDEREREKNLWTISKYYEEVNSIDKTITLIKDEKKKEEKSSYNVSEDALNNFGYNLMNKNKMEDALKVFMLNTELYPKSANTYDSLGECLLKLNRKEEGLKAYQKSLELNPKNENAKKVLAETK